MNGPSTLILPVESRVRELDAKLLLAAVAAERGFPVVLGSRPRIGFLLPALPRGVFFAKSMRFTSDRMTRLIRGFGHHLVASDEESLVRFAHPDYYAWRFSARSFAALKHLFAWGADDAAMFRSYPQRGRVAIHTTGNPRADLLREDVRRLFHPEAAALRHRFGRFILINTNFSFVNNFVPALNLLGAGAGAGARVGRTGRGMSPEFAFGMARHQQAIFDGFAALLPELSRAFDGIPVILRPHPSENHARWRRLCDGLANVQVIHEGNVVPWLQAAAVLLHNGCTTAVEAAVLGTPAVAYRPVESCCHDYHLPNRLSVEARSTDAVVTAVADILAGRQAGADPARRRRTLAAHLEMRGDRLAAERIVDTLVEHGYLEASPPPMSLRRRAPAWIETTLRTAVKRANLRRPDHRNGDAYLRHRFAPLGAGELNARIGALGNILGRFHDVRAVPLSTDVFRIERRAAARPAREAS